MLLLLKRWQTVSKTFSESFEKKLQKTFAWPFDFLYVSFESREKFLQGKRYISLTAVDISGVIKRG